MSGSGACQCARDSSKFLAALPFLVLKPDDGSRAALMLLPSYKLTWTTDRAERSEEDADNWQMRAGGKLENGRVAEGRYVRARK